ncbi:MAG: hypothetical protein KBT35_08115 [Firmicutes bacterium]|nr:hypothetical protein [Candidatus Colivicinus equi]
MVKEIGSYQSNIILQDDNNGFFNDELVWFISGRSALDYIIKDIKYKKETKKAALPSWCCDSMIAPFIINNIDVDFYDVIIEDGRLIKTINTDADVLLNIDYFGFEHSDVSFPGIIINDITHSVFTDIDEISDYKFCSLRKWAGFVTAGFAYSKDGFSVAAYNDTNDEYVLMRKNAMKGKENYLHDISTSKDYYDIFVRSEEQLNDLYGFAGTIQDINDAKHLNVEHLINRRKENARVLLNEFKEIAIFKEINDNDCPLYFPIIVPNGEKENLRKYLVQKNIYCPTHWQLTNLHNISDKAKYIYDNELSLICDQRYSVEDMRHLINEIKEYYKGI